MSPERRCSLRHLCRWPVRVTDEESGSYLDGVTRDVGLFGCFVETTTPFFSGRTIVLKITRDDQTFTVVGEVTHAVASEGMGIAFGAMASKGYTLLQEWLKEDPRGDAQQQELTRLAKA
jgi:hypothetical protein